jgi:hypothetical protein
MGKKYVTQSDKLSLILALGEFKQLSYEFLMNEAIKFHNTKGSESVYTLEQELNQLSKMENDGLKCYQFTPDSGEYETIRQFTKNPFTLIDLIYKYPTF